MLTAKMQEIDLFLRQVIHTVFPSEYIRYIFDGIICEDDVVIQVLLECCKCAYDKTAEKKSIRAHLAEDSDEDDIRMQVQRSNEKINKYRRAEYEYHKQSGLEIDGLLAPDMKSIDTRLDGYKYNDFQFWEIQNVKDMKLVWHIVNKSITRKNFTSYDIENDSEQYDDIIKELRETRDEIFYSLAFFTLEWKYHFEFFYALATEMSMKQMKSIPDLQRKISLLCGRPHITSILSIIAPKLGSSVITDSRMLVQRFKMIHEVVSNAAADVPQSNLHRYQEAIVLSTLVRTQTIYRDIPLMDWFCENTSKDDWKSVFQKYNAFQIYNPNKLWTGSIVRNLKYLYQESSIKLDFPEKRS